ncbi:hypothetical protein [Actinophytocola sp.]|uniref:hypothetical protein n=1 Tax=Actinophytocola sp. TaxID=1872138 RepID=UPI002ED54BBD
MSNQHRIGVGLVEDDLALFVPTDTPVVTMLPEDGRATHVPRAAGWALAVLGYGYYGGRVILISQPPDKSTRSKLGECLVTIMAVDDAIAGGHSPANHVGTGLAERTLHVPQQLNSLASAAGLDLDSGEEL